MKKISVDFKSTLGMFCGGNGGKDQVIHNLLNFSFFAACLPFKGFQASLSN